MCESERDLDKFTTSHDNMRKLFDGKNQDALRF